MSDSKKGASRRVTIMISDELDRKVRDKQAKGIKFRQSSYSYSQCLSDVLKDGFR